MVAPSRATSTIDPSPSHGVSRPEDPAWDFTRAIAKRRYVNTMRAEADGVVRSNNYPRKYPVSGSMPPATPWTIDLTDEDDHRFWFALFDLDAKTPDAFEQAAEDLGVLVRILRNANLPHVVCRSSPSGGFHVWVPLAGVETPVMQQLAAAARAVLPSLDHGLLCNERTGAARPPGSPHARGGRSTVMEGADPAEVLLTPTVSSGDLLRVIAAFRTLRPEVDPADQAPTGPVDPRHRGHRELPAWGRAHMATVGGGSDPSRTGYLCLLAAAVAGWTITDVEHAVRTAPGMEHYRTRNTPSGRREPRRPEEAASRLHRQWAKAQERAVMYRYSPQERAERDVTELEAIVATTEALLTSFRVSPGRWSRSESDFHDSTLLTALAWLSMRSGHRNVSASLRELAGLTGVPSSTVHRSLMRLRASGWIERRREAEGLEAAVWRITFEKGRKQFSTADEHDGPHQEVTARPPDLLFDIRAALLEEVEDKIHAGRHDVFTRAGLGPTARRAYEALTRDETSDQQVAARAGLPRGRALAALARLRRYSIAILTRSGWRRRLNDFRDQVAKKLGVDGILARREQQYTAEREQWAWWNAELTYRAGRRAKQRRRPATTQVMFRFTDERGDAYSWPAYPRDADGRPQHLEAMRFVQRGALQQLRDLELAA